MTSQGEHTMAPPASEQITSYMDVLRVVWPIALAGVLSAMALRLKDAMRESTVSERVTALLVTSIPSAVVSVGVVLLLPLLLPNADKITPSVEMGIAVVCGGLGTKVFDMWLRSKFNLVIRERKDDEE